MKPVFVLTVRQLGGSRRVWLVLGLVSLPLLAGLLYRAAVSRRTPLEFADGITETLLASAILPLVMLLLGISKGSAWGWLSVEIVGIFACRI